MNEAPQIYALLAKVAAEVGAVGKLGKNTQQNYAFRGIDGVMNAAHGPLAKHGVCILPEVLEVAEEVGETKGGSKQFHVRARFAFHFCGPDGSRATAITLGEAMDTGDKARNKAHSAALKYALTTVLCIPTEDMPDADADSPEAGTAHPAKAPAAASTLPAATQPPAAGQPAVPTDQGNRLGPVVAGTITKRSSKDGGTPDRPWKRYGFQIAGEWYGTFSESIGDRLTAVPDAVPVELEYELDAKGYRTIVSVIEPAQ